jgi:hypothetical protein
MERAEMAKKVKRSNKAKIPVPDKRDGKLKQLPPYRPTALPPASPKHPHHTPTPNTRGR